jgi:hypothetical protein
VAHKGFAENVSAWQVLDASAAESRFEALRTTTTPVVGRNEELELIIKRWQQAKRAEGCVVLLCLESRESANHGLRRPLSSTLAAEPHTRLRYFCSPQKILRCST